MTDIYTDGSFSGSAVGFGVRVEIGEGHETYGGHFVQPITDRALHEYFAIIEGALFAMQLGLTSAECKFITDCNMIVYGNQISLATGHGTNRDRENYLKQIIRVRKYYRPEEFNAALVFLSAGARFEWVKGHQHSVGNRRTDYLATYGRMRMSSSHKRFCSYEEWTKQSYSLYVAKDQQQTFHVPFAKPALNEGTFTYALSV